MSSFKLITVPLALLAISAVTGCMRFYPGTYVSAPADWIPVEVPEQGFAVRMPGNPVIERESQVAADGAPMTVVAGVAMTHEIAFGFRVVEDRAGFDGHPMTDGAFVDLATGNTGEPGASDEAPHVLARQEVESGGFSGEEVLLLDESAGLVTRVRVFRGRTRFYAAFVVHQHGNGARLDPLAQAYFDSLRMDPTDAPSPAGTGRLDPAQWQYIYPPEADFAVLVPGDARRARKEISIGEDLHHVNLYEVANQGTSFAVYEIRMGSRASSEDLDLLIDAVAPPGTHHRDQSNVSCQGFAGREVRFTAPDAVTRSRFFLTDGRIYEVRVSAPSSSPILDDPADRFFDSFRIL